MIPEFKFKKRATLTKGIDKRRVRAKLKELSLRIRDLDVRELLEDKRVRITGAAAMGVVVLGTVSVIAVNAGTKQSTTKKDFSELMKTAGVTTQINQAEKLLQQQYEEAEISLSKQSGATMTGTSYASAGGFNLESDAASEEAVADASTEEVSDAVTQEAVSAEEATPEAAAVTEEAAETTPEAVHPDLVGFSNPGIARVEQFVNIRVSPSESADICGKLPNNCACEILGEENGWYQVVTNGVEGYIKGEYLVTGEEAWELADQLKYVYARVLTETLNVRQEPSTGSAIITMVSLDDKLNIAEDLGDWLKVVVDNKEGYISKSYIAIECTLPKGEAVEVKKKSSSKSDSSTSSKAASDCSSVVAYATSFVGNPYVYGGSSLTNGTDCSGFTMRVYEKFGVYLPHSSAAQASCGTKVSTSDMQPGDLVFYGSGSSISHVAIYIGGGQIVHASSAKTGIKISNAFYRTPITVRRVK